MKKLPAPEFWARPGPAAQLLQPLAWIYDAAGRTRRALAHPWRAPVPVLCIGNLVAGGAGKTPVALSLARLLAARGARPHVLSRGYGGHAAGPLAVDPERHDASEVGDEPLLLARVAPTWVARDRVAGARAAAAAGAGLIVMDDGFQNSSLVKDFAILVIDGTYGFGNGRVMPAGPLRERIEPALARADAIVLIGEDEADLACRLGHRPVLGARLVPRDGATLAGPLVAFAGIARPEKFFRTLGAMGGALVAQHAFPDHYPYAEAELVQLAAAAAAARARLITTEKDWVRLPRAWRDRVAALAVEIAWQNGAAAALLERIAATGMRHG